MTVSVERVHPQEITELLVRINLLDNELAIMHYCLSISSQCWRGLIDEEIVCIWGLVPPSLLSERAYLWLYTNERVKGNEFLFVRHSQIAVREMLKLYPTIVGHCIVGAESSIRWLHWLGAKFADPDGERLPFVIGRANG